MASENTMLFTMRALTMYIEENGYRDCLAKMETLIIIFIIKIKNDLNGNNKSWYTTLCQRS
jgi:hypothetical protein